MVVYDYDGVYSSGQLLALLCMFLKKGHFKTTGNKQQNTFSLSYYIFCLHLVMNI